MFLDKIKIPEKYRKIVFAFNKEGTLYFLNEQAQYLLAKHSLDLMYKNFLKLFTPDSRSLIKQKIIELTTDNNKTEPFTVKLEVDKQTKRRLTLTALFDESNILVGYIGELNTDRQEYVKLLEKAEKNYKQFLDNIPIGIYRTTIEGNIVYANKLLLNIFNYNKLSDFQDVKNIFADKSYRKNKLKTWIEQGEYSEEFEIKTSDGRFLYVKDVGKLVREEGKPMYFDGALEDITDKKALEKKLNESNTSKNKFFSILSHDLKGAFGQFIGATDLILSEIDNFDKEQIENIVRLLNQQAERTYKLLGNLLDWSKSQEGILKFMPEPVNLSVLTADIIEYYMQRALDKSIDLSADVKSSLIVYADKYMLSTILRNLVSNAIKFTPEGGKVSVEAKRIVAPDNSGNKVIEVSVKDTGVGIENERMKQLFDLENNYSTKGTNGEMGTGLGLILCKEFVDKQGGKIWVESKIGKGSIFKFTIP